MVERRTRVVFVSGMPRSGSTFSFNVVREILELHGKVYQEASPDLGAVLRKAQDAGADRVILKAHQADAELIRAVEGGAVLSVCTVRPIEQAAASWIDTFGFNVDQTIAAMLEWLKMYARLREKSLVISYAEIQHRPLFAVWRIRRYVDRSVSPLRTLMIAYNYRRSKVKALVDQMRRDSSGVRDVGFSFYDEKTFFHRRHLSDDRERRIEEYLEAGDVARLRAAIAPALAAISDRRLSPPARTI